MLAYSSKCQLHRQGARAFSLLSARWDEYRQVPHYKQKSALYVRTPLSSDTAKHEVVFPKVISPDLDVERFFTVDGDHSLKPAICRNLSARHAHLNTVKLREDFSRMLVFERELYELSAQKDAVSEQIRTLTKVKMTSAEKRAVVQSESFMKLAAQGNELKQRLTKLGDELAPLDEIVKVACLRLPNDLHFSTCYLHKTQLDDEKLILFDFNQRCLDDVKRRAECVTHPGFWTKVYAHEEKVNGLSFVEQASVNVNLKYLVGSFAQVTIFIITIR